MMISLSDLFYFLPRLLIIQDLYSSLPETEIVKGVTWTNQLYLYRSKTSSPKTI